MPFLPILWHVAIADHVLLHCPGPNARGEWTYSCVTEGVLNLTGLRFDDVGQFVVDPEWDDGDLNTWENFSGGAIRTNGFENLTVVDSCFVSCYSLGGGGGAIYCDTLARPEACTGTVILRRLYGNKCYAGRFGSFLCCDPEVYVEQVSTLGCLANKTGGSMEWYNYGELSDINVTKCTSTHYVVNAWQCEGYIDYALFTQNQDTYCVVGVQDTIWEDGVLWGNMSCTDCIFYRNDAPAWYSEVNNSFILLTNCYLEDTDTRASECPVLLDSCRFAGKIPSLARLTVRNCEQYVAEKTPRAEEDEVAGCVYWVEAEGGLSNAAKIGITVAIVVVVVAVVVGIAVWCCTRRGRGPRPDDPMVVAEG